MSFVHNVDIAGQFIPELSCLRSESRRRHSLARSVKRKTGAGTSPSARPRRKSDGFGIDMPQTRISHTATVKSASHSVILDILFPINFVFVISSE